MKSPVGYLWLIFAILITIIVYSLYGSSKSQILVFTRANANTNENVVVGEEDVQRRLQEAEEIWVRGVQNREEAAKRTKPKEDKPYGMVAYRVLWDFFYADYNCPHNMERLGRVGDGGKWICGVPQLAKKGSDCTVYSYGIAGDTSFEKDILDRTNCSVHGYDHTIKAEKVSLPKNYPGRATVSKIGIGVKDTDNLRTLKSEMDARGHKFIDVLKMDVEGAEFKALEQILEDFPDGLPFGQLLIEIHLNSIKTDLYKTFRTWWDKLEAAGLRAFHNEPNWYIFAMTDKKRNPFCFEYSFLNVKVDHAVLHA